MRGETREMSREKRNGVAIINRDRLIHQRPGMRINLGNDTRSYGGSSYLDAADDIIGLPTHQLMRVTRLSERSGAWFDDYTDERVPDFLYRIYGLASQI
jgi:hypothetical protein